MLATLDHLGIGRAHLVGCSFRAGVAVELALRAAVARGVAGAGRPRWRAVDGADRRAACRSSRRRARPRDAATSMPPPRPIWWRGSTVRAAVPKPSLLPCGTPYAPCSGARSTSRSAGRTRSWEAEHELDPPGTRAARRDRRPRPWWSQVLSTSTRRMAADMVAARVPRRPARGMAGRRAPAVDGAAGRVRGVGARLGRRGDRLRSRVRAAGMTPGWSAFSAA